MKSTMGGAYLPPVLRGMKVPPVPDPWKLQVRPEAVAVGSGAAELAQGHGEVVVLGGVVVVACGAATARRKRIGTVSREVNCILRDGQKSLESGQVKSSKRIDGSQLCNGYSVLMLVMLMMVFPSWRCGQAGFILEQLHRHEQLYLALRTIFYIVARSVPF